MESVSLLEEIAKKNLSEVEEVLSLFSDLDDMLCKLYEDCVKEHSALSCGSMKYSEY